MSEKELEQLKKEFKKLIEKSNKKIYVNIVKIGYQNMTWYFRAYTVVDNELIDISYYLNKLDLYKFRETNEGYLLRGQGIGMDRSFEVASAISYFLYNDDYKLRGYFI